MEKHLTAGIKIPTLVLDEKIAKRNLKRMAEKAAAQDIRFRPHFKTHQSAEVGDWMRVNGVEHITVSSVKMAQFFADKGWHDILIAFPINLRESTEIEQLAAEIELSLLVESVESAKRLNDFLGSITDVWIKIDTGMNRAGIWWENINEIFDVAKSVISADHLRLKGLLTHAGQTYHASSINEIMRMYSDSNSSIISVRESLQNHGIKELELSVGDTPGCWLSDDLGDVDEIRPGNFIFFDAMMHNLGVCLLEEIAVAVACPVVAKHESRNEVVIYGGAVHLSKEFIHHEGNTIYGYVALNDDFGWRILNSGNFVKSLSQEHGIIQVASEHFSRIGIGDLIYVIPVHVCLAVDALKREYIILPDNNQ